MQTGSNQNQKVQVLTLMQTPGDTKGFLQDELRNITFDGEQDAANETTREFAEYLNVDAQIRALENSGKHQDAINLCLSTSPPNGSNYVFGAVDDALKKTIDINQTQFDLRIADGLNGIGVLRVADYLVALLLCGLIGTGVWPRIQEYFR